MVDRTKGRRPKNRPCDSGDDSDPGLATQRDRDLTATQRGTLEPAWVLHQGEGTQRPQCVKGKGPENPGVAAPLAAAGCRGNCWCAGRVFSVVRRWTTTSRLPRPLRVVPHEPSSTFHDGDGGRHATVLVERGLSRASGVRVCSPCRAHLFALDVILCAPISLFAFVAESAKARLRRHGPELHRCVIVCRLRLFLSYCSWRLAGLHFLFLGLKGETKVFFSTRRGQSPVVTPCSRNPVTIRFGLIFRTFSSTVRTAFQASSKLHADSGALQTDIGPEGANFVGHDRKHGYQISCVFLIHRERRAKASRSTWRTRAVHCLCVITVMDIGKQGFLRSYGEDRGLGARTQSPKHVQSVEHYFYMPLASCTQLFGICVA